MGGGKETGRQKMIGMMYLFLTALLALNVSKEIINAFVVINKGIEETNSNFSMKIASQYAGFESEYNKNPVKAQAYWDKAKQIRAESAKTIAYLTELKARVVAQASDKDQEQYKKYIGKDKNGVDTLVNLMSFDKKDDYDSPTYVLIGSDPAIPSKGPHTAHEMMEKITAYKKILQSACPEDKAMQKRFDDAFSFKPAKNAEGHDEEWALLNFFHCPVVASVAIFSKLQADVKNAESDAIKYLMDRIGADDLKFTKVIPIVRVKSALIGVGDSLVAQIAMGAIDETKSPQILVQGKPVKVSGGVGYLSERPTTPGDQTWKGVIRYEGPSGTTNLDFEIPFKVAASTDAVIDPSAMNVLYVGLDNPINVSVPGADSDKLNINCSNPKVKITKVKTGVYSFKPDGAFANKEEVEVTVSGETTTGGKKGFGGKKFRLKNLPKPEPLIGGKGPSDGSISMGALKDAVSMTAILRDFVFDGVKFNITKFTMVVPGAGGDIPFQSNGPSMTEEMKQQIAKMRPKQRISFTDIQAIGPDKQPKLLGNLSFKIQ